MVCSSFEKDQITDASQKIRESQDTEKKVIELNDKLQQVREQVRPYSLIWVRGPNLLTTYILCRTICIA